MITKANLALIHVAGRVESIALEIFVFRNQLSVFDCIEHIVGENRSKTTDLIRAIIKRLMAIDIENHRVSAIQIDVVELAANRITCKGRIEDRQVVVILICET